jgi:hypothetical protein
MPLSAEQVVNDIQADKKFDYTIRYGQGGFNDSRSPEGKLGGGQIALDIYLKDSPFSILVSSEFYKNSRFATHNYEITGMFAINLLYHTDFPLIENTTLFFGGGIGSLRVPESETNPNSTISTDLLNLELGLYLRPHKQFGYYAVLKHLQADRDVNNVKFIDFNETIFLIGISYDFNLF